MSLAFAPPLVALPAQDAPPPRIGIALSGGSAKGFAHIGVLEELERAGVRIDIVGGTSSGSLVGGLYAIGYSPAALRRVALTEDWGAIFTGRTPRDQLAPIRKLESSRFLVSVPVRGSRVDLPTAFVGSQQLTGTLARLVWSADTIADLRALPLPFVAVASDLETGSAIPITSGPLSAAIRASMSLPGVFAPEPRDGRRLIDGGVARNIPATDVRALGADLVLCVDVSGPLSESDSLSSALGIMMQVLSFQMAHSNDAERAQCDVLISPDLRGLSSASFDQTDEWISRGSAAARSALPAILAILEARQVPLRPAPASRASDAAPRLVARRIAVDRLDVRGDPVAPGVAAAAGIVHERGRSLSAADAELLAARLYATGRYEVVSARPVASEDGVALHLEATPANRDRIGLGLRYDSQFKAALLFGIEVNDRLGDESTTTLDVRLGEQLAVEFEHRPGLGATDRLVRSLGLTYVRTPLDLFFDGLAIARADVQVLSASAFAGVVIPRHTLTGVQVAWESMISRAAIAPERVPTDSRAYLALSVISWTETFDRAAFPTRGMQLFLQSELADREFIGNASFVRSVADLEVRGALREGTTLLARVAAGEARGPNLPVFNHFFLGGGMVSAVLPGRSFAFAALRPQQRLGSALQLAELGIQQELRRSTYVILRGTAGNTFDAWPGVTSLRDYLIGASAALGVLTPIGPATLTLGGRRLDAWPLATVEVGFRF